eukprot:scaffold52519_cov27-Phaeocystis_antarctica.AAC.2
MSGLETQALGIGHWALGIGRRALCRGRPGWSRADCAVFRARRRRSRCMRAPCQKAIASIEATVPAISALAQLGQECVLEPIPVRGRAQARE